MDENSLRCLRAIGLIVCIYEAVMIFHIIDRWYRASDLYSKPPWYQAWDMLRFTLRTNEAYSLYLPLLAPLSIVLGWYYFTNITFPVSWILGIILFQLHILTYHASPPAILLLGNSRAETIDLREQLERHLFPYRIVVLLDATVIETSHSLFRRNLLAWDNLWVRSIKKWRLVSYPLMDMVPIIIVDTRVVSPAVFEETQRILASSLIHKAILLVEPNGDSPLLEKIDMNPNIGSIMSTEQELIPLLRLRWLDDARSVPDLF